MKRIIQSRLNFVVAAHLTRPDFTNRDKERRRWTATFTNRFADIEVAYSAIGDSIEEACDALRTTLEVRVLNALDMERSFA